MPQQLIKVDLAVLDTEIADIKHQLQKRVELREFLAAYGEPIVPQIKIDHETFDIGYGPTKPNLQISEFILELLKDGERRTAKEVGEAYALYVGKNAEDIKNNIANALSRLKDGGKLESEIGDGERAAKWHKKIKD